MADASGIASHSRRLLDKLSFSASTSTKKAPCGCDPVPAPSTPSMFCVGSEPNGPRTSGSSTHKMEGLSLRRFIGRIVAFRLKLNFAFLKCNLCSR